MRDELDNGYAVADEGAMKRWRARLGRVASVWGGALLAVAVIVGVALWGYGLTQRDASSVPVIRAALTPAKVQPHNPGGAQIAYRDITAYHAGSPRTAAPTDIVFAPPPERPSPQDVSMAALTGGATTTTAAAAAPQPPATDTAPAATPLVRPRPVDLKQRMEAAQQAASEQEQLAARAAASPVQIQLGAYPDRDQTRSMWQRIYRANQDILRGRALVIQSTISGGQRYFRLRAGPFKDRLEAQNVCRALQSRGQDCLVAVNG